MTALGKTTNMTISPSGAMHEENCIFLRGFHVQVYHAVLHTGGRAPASALLPHLLSSTFATISDEVECRGIGSTGAVGSEARPAISPSSITQPWKKHR